MTDKSVGLIVLTEIPELGMVALLRERGYLNLEKMAPESWPGLCQVTVHGRLEDDETFFDALLRETCEELGQDFAFYLSGLIAQDPKKLREVLHTYDGGKEVITLCICVELWMAKKIRLAPDSGALRPVNKGKAEEIVDTIGFKKKEGVPTRITIAMFPDERDAVIRALS